ncbi:MAG: hypothetical protein COA42_03050 [Alteromonadaceae bacterium]|nr:MAG: hypothetical protein COA42_03050 [Alteromonadaceae bacterium]
MTNTAPLKKRKRANPFAQLIATQVDEASSLWLLRSAATKQAHHNQASLHKLDTRINKHISALLLHSEDAWTAAFNTAQDGFPSDVFILIILAFISGDVKKIQQATEVAILSTAHIQSASSALTWLPNNTTKSWLSKFLASKDLRHKQLALTILSVRRINPGDYLDQLLNRDDCIEDKALYTRALRLTGELKRHDLQIAIARGMGAEDEEIAFWAYWSNILNGGRAALEKLTTIAMQLGSLQLKAIDILLRILPPNDARKWISKLSAQPDQFRQLVQASAALGDPQVIPWLINSMKTQSNARICAQAFTTITGIDLEEQALTSEVPSLEERIAAEPEDMDEALKDEHLPWPDAEKIAAAWQGWQGGFVNGTRYLLGRPIDATHLQSVLKHANQCHRHDAALELALLNPQTILPNIKASTCKMIIPNHASHPGSSA